MARYGNHPRYIPIIKWQFYEQRALEKVDSTLLNRILPCIEIRTSKQHDNLLTNVSKVWPHDVLVDYSNPSGQLTPNRESELLAFLQYASQQGLPVTPVLGPADIMKSQHHLVKLMPKLTSIVIRLRLDSLKLSDDLAQLTESASTLMQSAGIKSSLIVDLGVSPDTWTSTEVVDFGKILKTLDVLKSESVHLLSGAYPQSLASVKTGIGKFERRDWKFWEAVNGAVPELGIGFSDYGTLAPGWTEEVLNHRSNRIALRYTRNDDWLILRADGKTRDDSISISKILVNQYPSDFKGAPYSFGDKLIETRTNPAGTGIKCGHYHITESWSHHIAHVLKEQY